MLDKAIKILRVTDQPVFEPGGNIRYRKAYSFMVGNNGPFLEVFEANEQHADAIHRRLNEHVRLLRETGALAAEET